MDNTIPTITDKDEDIVAVRGKTKRRRPGAKLAKFLKHVIVDEGMTREEAARKGNVSEGYLCHILAGNVQMPRPDKFNEMAKNWPFSRINALAAADLIDDKDIEQYVARKKALEIETTPRMQLLIRKLSLLSKEQQEHTSTLFLSTLSLMQEFHNM